MKKSVKIILITVLLLIVLTLVCAAIFVFGSIGEKRIVVTIESPNGIYYAEVVESDQGALGGNTFVYVYKDIDIFDKNMKIRCKKLYQGDWGEFENMNIYWKDNECIVINSEEYEI